MDIQVGLICVTVAIISAVIIYVISMSTMKEKTYDEAMADLRKKTEEQFSQGKTAKEKSKDKKEKKKAGKKVKEKAAPVVSDVDFPDGTGKNHVAFVEPEAAVVDSNKNVNERKKPNKKKDKPILLNKNEPSIIVADKPPVVLNHFEKIHPKDDVELKRSHSREEMKLPAATSTTHAGSFKEQHGKKQATKGNNNNANAAEQKVEKSQNQSKPQNQPKPQRPPPPKQQIDAVEKKLAKEVEKPVSTAPANNNTTISNNDKVEPPVKQTAVTNQQSALSSNQSTPSHNEKKAAVPSVKMSKKQKSELAHLNQISGDHREAININLLLPLVGKAELSKSELQLLIEFLLNKQQGIADGSSEWIEGRQDPVVKLKKQLAEKEKALTDEIEASTGFQVRLKEIRVELNAEKHNTRTLEEALHARQNEISALAMKLQHSVDEKQALAQQIQQMQAKLNEERLLVRKLQEDGGQAQNALQQELLGQRQQLEIHITRLSETQHQQQETIASLEAQLGESMQANEALTNELAILQERSGHLQDAAAQIQELAHQVEELRNIRSNLERVVASGKFETGRLQTELAELSEKFNHIHNENEKLNGAVQTLQNENARLREAHERLSMQASSAAVEARQLRDENESLAAQVTASMERPATEGRENGDANSYSEGKLSHLENQDNLQKKELLLEELGNKLKGKEIQVEKLTGEVNTFKTEVLEQQRHVQSLKDEVEKHRLEAERLAKDLLQQKSHVAQLVEQLNTQQAKNNEAVKSAADKIMLEQQSSTRQLLQRVFPEITVPECKGHLEWFGEVEKALRGWKPQEADSQNASCFADLEKQNAQLQAMVTHYKNIIADTEGMLNRLQSHVEQEEGKWGEELQTLHSQLEAVTRERDALQASCSTGATNGYHGDEK